MGQSHTSIILALQLCLIQGITSQKWDVKIAQWHICTVTGSSVVVLCNFTHPPDVVINEVFWVIDPVKGQESLDLKETPEYSGRVNYSADIGKNCTLVLDKVKPSDAHMYHARFASSGPKWLSNGVKLLVGDLTVQLREPVIEGQDVELICNSSCSLTNNPTLVWRRNGNVLPGKQTDNNNKKLLLKSITIEDQGQYSCELQDSVGHSSKPVKLNVMFSPKNITLSIIPSSAILKGSSVNLTCSSDANPPVENYTWFKVDESTPVGSGQQYSITNISSEDGGQYYCEARNKYGAQNSTVVLITVEEDKAFMIYVVIGVSSGVGILAVFCIPCLVSKRLQGNPENPNDQNVESERNNKGPSDDYENFTCHSNDLDSVYQNYQPDATGKDDDYVDDDIYQNV